MAKLPNDSKKKEDKFDDIVHEREGTRPDFSQPLPRKQLPREIQDTLDNEEKFWDTVTSGKGDDTTESNIRYAAYASRLRTILLSAHRYVAYTSDIGESFRPVAHPNWVRTAYGVSWAYLIGDVSHEGYKAYMRNQKALHPEIDTTVPGSTLIAPQQVAPIDHWATVATQRAIFQSVASMGLPAFTIHSIVRYSGQAMKNIKNTKIRTWGPIGLGLAAVPALPFMFDKPVEEATEWIFHKGFEMVGGPEAVGHKSVTQALVETARKGSDKEL